MSPTCCPLWVESGAPPCPLRDLPAVASLPRAAPGQGEGARMHTTPVDRQDAPLFSPVSARHWRAGCQRGQARTVPANLEPVHPGTSARPADDQRRPGTSARSARCSLAHQRPPPRCFSSRSRSSGCTTAGRRAGRIEPFSKPRLAETTGVIFPVLVTLLRRGRGMHRRCHRPLKR